MRSVGRLRLAVFIAVLPLALSIAILLIVVRIDLLSSVYLIFSEVDSRINGELNVKT